MIVLDKDFQSLIPPLSEDEYRQLEQNILKDGIRDPLVVWQQEDGNAILVDGHNRKQIAEQHDISYETVGMNFSDREDAKRWIILNQFGRRNLSAYDRSLLALKLKPILAKEAKKQQGTRTDISQKSVKSHDTQKELAKVAGVSHDTIHKVEAIENSNDDTLKAQVKSGDLSINQGYLAIRGVGHKSPAQQKKEFIAEAKKECEEFQQKKDQGLVTISEVRADKQNRQAIANDLYIRCMRMGERIAQIQFEEDEKAIDLKSMARTMSEADILKLQNEITNTIRTLHKILAKVVKN